MCTRSVYHVTATFAPLARLSIAALISGEKPTAAAAAAIRVLGVCGGGGWRTRYHKRYNILYSFLYYIYMAFRTAAAVTAVYKIYFRV